MQELQYCTLSVTLGKSMHTTYEDGTECSETSADKIQTPGNHQEERTQQNQYDLYHVLASTLRTNNQFITTTTIINQHHHHHYLRLCYWNFLLNSGK